MKKSNGVNYSMAKPKQLRRKRVIERLEYQLELGHKRVSEKDENGNRVDTLVKLTESEINRIKKEIETLKTRC